MEEFKCLGTILTNQNSIRKEIKSRLRSGNACCHSVQNLLSSSLISKNIKIKIHRTIIVPVVVYGCETWSLTLREECRMRVFETVEVTGEWRKLHNEELNVLYSSPNIIWVIKLRMQVWAGNVACLGGEVHTLFWWGNLREEIGWKTQELKGG